MENKQNIKWWWNIPIILLIGILVSLGIRSIVTDDNRFGWGTFSKQTSFSINYYWVGKDGKRQRYLPGKELNGKARKKLKRRGSTRYSVGALESWVNNYVRYMYLNNKVNENTGSFLAVVRYRINSTRVPGKRSNDAKQILIEYPSNTGDQIKVD